jgi:hypothetical protein
VVSPAVESPGLEEGHPAATGLEEGHPAAVSVGESAADPEFTELEPSDSAFDIGSAPVSEPSVSQPPAPVEPPAPANPPVSDLAEAAEAPTPASPSPRPRPRPRPRPDGAGSTQVETPPAGSASVERATGEETPASGFGPTSATEPPAPPHALFTPASTDGVGAGAVPGPDGEAPGPEFTIKGNASSMLFHTPASPYYERTRAEVWFRTADEAVAAGFKEWRPQRRTG